MLSMICWSDIASVMSQNVAANSDAVTMKLIGKAVVASEYF